jgi:hypothetical protein
MKGQSDEAREGVSFALSSLSSDGRSKKHRVGIERHSVDTLSSARVTTGATSVRIALGIDEMKRQLLAFMFHPRWALRVEKGPRNVDEFSTQKTSVNLPVQPANR